MRLDADAPLDSSAECAGVLALESQVHAALVAAYRDGSDGALDRLVGLAYAELKRIARGQVRLARDATLDTTSLVHEMYLRVLRAGPLAVDSYAHFMATCARVMRQLMSNHVRDRQAGKRGGGSVHVMLDDASTASAFAGADDHVLVDQALEALEAIDPRLLQVFECRVFGGMSEEETASALGVSLRTVQRDALRARTWLRELLGDGVPPRAAVAA